MTVLLVSLSTALSVALIPFCRVTAFAPLPIPHHFLSRTSTVVLQETAAPSSFTPLPEVAHQALPLHTFAGQVERCLQEMHEETEIQSVLQCWRMLNADHQYKTSVSSLLSDNEEEDAMAASKNSWRTQICNSYVPGLTVREFWDTTSNNSNNSNPASTFPWIESLKSKYPSLLKELKVNLQEQKAQQVEQQGNNIWAGALTEEAASYGVGWKTLVLKDKGYWDATNCQLFPQTAQAIHDANIPAVEVFFASMEPHSEIAPHSDFTNFVLTSHLALDIPYSGTHQCRLRIGDTTREWINGQVTVFDTSLLHDAVNESDQTRYILMMRIWHPDLSTAQREALQYIYDVLHQEEALAAQLISTNAVERQVALDEAQRRRAFPNLKAMAVQSGVKRGFGGGGGGGVAAGKAKKKKTKKNKK